LGCEEKILVCCTLFVVPPQSPKNRPSLPAGRYLPVDVPFDI
jgi:hypothetical protein